MADPLDENEFDRLADRSLRALEVAVNDLDEVEADLESGILTIEFSDGERFVVNSHRAARQIWMAAGGRAWHFDVQPSNEKWTATKTGDELWSCLEQQLAQKLSHPVRLARR